MSVLEMIVLVAVMTFVLRALPFLIFSGQKQLPSFLVRMQKQLPCAVMILLVVYCVKGVSIKQVSSWLPHLSGIVATVVVHWKKKNVLLSMVIGTLVYMLLM